MARNSNRSYAKALQRRMATRVAAMTDAQLHAYLAEGVYLERKRLLRSQDSTVESEREAIEAAARAVHQDRAAMSDAVLQLTKAYAYEIHNKFSSRTYAVATKLLPGALTRLLTSASPMDVLGSDFDPTSRISVHGPLDTLRELAQNHTLILAPTHVSNLDSPLIGYALHQAGLPPFIYGAGLNLFSNTGMAFFMSRLGAYTVDRRKRHRIYKDTLKDYSTQRIGQNAHSLFFPGGTRSRSGQIETRLKRGLLGTAIQAWQEGLQADRPHPEILVVPCTLSFSMVLEAETLIEDWLSEEGQSRYIITDDEFSEPSTVLQFARRVMTLDAGIHIRFGTPVDLLGNSVDEQGNSLDASGHKFDRRAYVTGHDAAVIVDPQRDQIYTNQLAEVLARAYQKDNTVLSTHIVARAALDCLARRYPRLDTYQMMLLAPFERWVDRTEVVAQIQNWLDHIDQRTADGRVHQALPSGDGSRAEGVLNEAVERFASFHSHPAVEYEDWRILVDPKLALYYGNRLAGIPAPEDTP